MPPSATRSLSGLEPSGVCRAIVLVNDAVAVDSVVAPASTAALPFSAKIVEPRTVSFETVPALAKPTRAVVPTHLWGLPCDMDGILEVAHRHKLVVIEDCAHALGASYRGQPVGTIGDAALFSFQTPAAQHGAWGAWR